MFRRYWLSLLAMVIGLSLSLTVPFWLKDHFSQFVNGPDGPRFYSCHTTSSIANFWDIRLKWLEAQELEHKGNPTVVVGVNVGIVPPSFTQAVLQTNILSFVTPITGLLLLLWASQRVRKRSLCLRAGLILLCWSAVSVAGVKYVVTERWLDHIPTRFDHHSITNG